MIMPEVKPTLDNRYILARPYILDGGLVIPAGYKTNGANIPRLFWFIIPPFKPKYLPAVIIHDFLCDKEQYKKADELFAKYLLNIENSWKTRAMIKAVKLYHFIRYKTPLKG